VPAIVTLLKSTEGNNSDLMVKIAVLEAELKAMRALQQRPQ
jgi:hypothetical protein